MKTPLVREQDSIDRSASVRKSREHLIELTFTNHNSCYIQQNWGEPNMHRFLQKKTAWAQMLIILFVLTFATNICPARASNTIRIMPDGSIDPISAPISRNGSLYYFTDNINESIILLSF